MATATTGTQTEKSFTSYLRSWIPSQLIEILLNPFASCYTSPCVRVYHSTFPRLTTETVQADTSTVPSDNSTVNATTSSPKRCPCIIQSGSHAGQPCEGLIVKDKLFCDSCTHKRAAAIQLSNAAQASNMAGVQVAATVETKYCHCWSPTGEIKPCLAEVKAGETYCETCKTNPKPLHVANNCNGTVPSLTGQLPCANISISGEEFCPPCKLLDRKNGQQKHRFTIVLFDIINGTFRDVDHNLILKLSPDNKQMLVLGQLVDEKVVPLSEEMRRIAINLGGVVPNSSV